MGDGFASRKKTGWKMGSIDLKLCWSCGATGNLISSRSSKDLILVKCSNKGCYNSKVSTPLKTWQTRVPENELRKIILAKNLGIDLGEGG